jgi:hypothetical protein
MRSWVGTIFATNEVTASSRRKARAPNLPAADTKPLSQRAGGPNVPREHRPSIKGTKVRTQKNRTIQVALPSQI